MIHMIKKKQLNANPAKTKRENFNPFLSTNSLTSPLKFLHFYTENDHDKQHIYTNEYVFT